jgi:amidase
LTTSPTGGAVHPDCVAAATAAAALCESLGHQVEEATMDVDGDAFVGDFVNAWAAGNAWALGDWEERVGRAATEDDVEPLTWALVQIGRALDSARYLKAVQGLQRATRQIASAFEEIDVLVTPTLAEPPAPLGTFDAPPGEPLAGLFRAADYTPFTPPFNVTGQPGISLPLSWNEAGLPIGVQFVGRFGDEETLLSFEVVVVPARRRLGRSGSRSRARAMATKAKPSANADSIVASSLMPPSKMIGVRRAARNWRA